MIRHLSILLAVMPSLGSAQEYQPFVSGMQRAFLDDSGLGRVYSLASDPITASNGDTTYANYFLLNAVDSQSDFCSGWGWPNCLKQDLPSWFGPRLEGSTDGSFRLFNILGDTLHLDPGIPFGDTSAIFQDQNQLFSLIYEQRDTATFLGIPDSARYYRILHTDPTGNPINSALQGSRIIIGKDLGMISFFQVDSFPAVLRPIHMIGDAVRQVGLYSISEATVHDYGPGDVVQYRSASGTYPPPSNSVTFTKYTILARTETATDVTYTVSSESFHVGQGGVTLNSGELTYSKIDVIAEIPFEEFNGSSRYLNFFPHCGHVFGAYGYSPVHGLGYCEADDCWTGIDTNGPPPSDEYGYLLGVGHTYSHLTYPIGPLGVPTSSSLSIPYFKKNGIPCGVEAFVGIEENSFDHSLIISPVPSDGHFTVQANSPIQHVDILDLQGRNVAGFIASGTNVELELGDRPEGLYMVHVQFLNGTRAIRRLIIAH